jgi:hypothetical protein
MSKDQLALQAGDGPIQCDHPACKEPLDPSLCTDRCVVVECDGGVVDEQCEQGCVVDRAYGCPYDKEESSSARANDDVSITHHPPQRHPRYSPRVSLYRAVSVSYSDHTVSSSGADSIFFQTSVCPSTSPQTALSPINLSHNIDPALISITSNHTEDSINGVHSFADLHLGPQSPVLTCLWGDCKESFHSRPDLLSHLHAVHLQYDVIQAHKRATNEPPPYHRFLNPNSPMTPNLICDWQHCHEELTPFKAPGPSTLNGFDASLLALSNHIVNEHFGLDPYGQHFFSAQQPLSAHQPYFYQQQPQQNQSTLFNPNGITPPRSLRWPIQEERETWNPPKIVDYFDQSNEPDQGCCSDMSQSSTWPEGSPNHGRIERNSTARYDPYSPRCRATSAIRLSQSKVQGKARTKASPRATLLKSPLASQSNMAGTNKPTTNGVGLPALSASAANPGTFCCHWTGCPVPGLDFGSSDNLTAHITTQHVGSGKKTYDCFWDACDRNGEKSFPSKQKILRHLQVCFSPSWSPSPLPVSFEWVWSAGH